MSKVDDKYYQVDHSPTDEPLVKGFYRNLIDIGFFPRAYAAESEELYNAAKVLWEHCCRLDTAHYRPIKGLFIHEFANCYAKLAKGRRLLEGDKEKVDRFIVDHFKGV